MSKKIKELKLSKVNEVSLCTTFCPPANGLKSFEIVKSAIKKDAYSDLFEEMEMLEYGEFMSYLGTWLDEDVNRVAYSAFLDALFASLQDIVYMEDLDKGQKADKFKETFDSFISEYQNSVITKTESGEVKLNIGINKQEKNMSILEKLQSFVSELTKTEEVEAIEVPTEEVIEEVVEAEEVEQPEGQQTEVEEVTETIDEPIIETVEEPESEDAIQEEVVEVVETEIIEVVENIEGEKTEEVTEVVETQEPEVETEEVIEVTEEVAEEIEVEKSVSNLEEIIKATQDENSILKAKLEEIEKANIENQIKLEKAELMEEVTKSFYGLPKSKDEVVEVLYELKKSKLSEVSVNFIKESLKSLSKSNEGSFEELGHSEEIDVNKTETETILEKAQKLVEAEGLDENQAILVVKGRRTLEQAKKVSDKLKK